MATCSTTDLPMIIWCSAQRVDLLQRILQQMPEMQVRAIGGPRKGPLQHLAKQQDVPVFDDLRTAMHQWQPRILMLITSSGVAAEHIMRCRDQQITVWMLEPPVFATMPDEDQLPTMITVPTWTAAPAWIAASQAESVIGNIQSLNYQSNAPVHAMSLFARLADAYSLITTLLGLPTTIDASLTGPLAEPPTDFRAVTGHIAAHLRCELTNASAVIQVSDRCGYWHRRLTLIGTDGTLQLTDESYQLRDAEGQIIDQLKPSGDPVDPIKLMAFQWALVARTGLSHHPTTDYAGAQACCRATGLSCRTGQSESPAHMLELAAQP